jgi:hypothetical protein
MQIVSASVRVMLFACVIFCGLLAAPIGFVAGFAGGSPNLVSTPFLEQWPLLKLLWASNPKASVQIFMQQPLLVIAHGESADVLPAWRLFFYPLPLAACLAVSVFAAVVVNAGTRATSLKRLVALLPGMPLLACATAYAQIAACCTGGPRWILDVWLYALAYDPLNRLIDWQGLYLRVEGMLPVLQAALAMLGVLLLMLGAWPARDVRRK